MTDAAARRAGLIPAPAAALHTRVASTLRRLGTLLVGVGVFLVAYIEWRPAEVLFTYSDALFVLGAVLILCGGGFRLHPFGGTTTYWLVAFVLMLLGLLVGSVINGDPIRWLIAAVQYGFGFVLLPYLLVGDSDIERRLILFAKLMIAGLICMEAFGIAVYYFYDGSYQDYQKIARNFITGGQRLGAFLGQANWNAAFISMVTPFLIYLTVQKKLSLLVASVSGGILGVGLILSASFTGVISTAIVLTLFLLIAGARYAVRVLLGVVVVVGILAAAGYQPPEVFRTRVGDALETGDLNQAGTYAGRMDLIREAWTIVDDTMIVGLGVDRYRVVSAIDAPVHNMYLLLWAEGGLLALIGWLALLTIVLLTSIRALGYDRAVAALGLSVLAAFIIFSTASPHMYARVWLVPLVLAMGFMTIRIPRSEENTR